MSPFAENKIHFQSIFGINVYNLQLKKNDLSWKILRSFFTGPLVDLVYLQAINNHVVDHHK